MKPWTKDAPKGGELERERYFLECEIARTEEFISKAQQEWLDKGGCPCCFWAAHGGSHSKVSYLADKNERREARLKIVKKKLEKENARLKDNGIRQG